MNGASASGWRSNTHQRSLTKSCTGAPSLPCSKSSSPAKPPRSTSDVGEAARVALVERDLEQQVAEGAGETPVLVRVPGAHLADTAHGRRLRPRGLDQAHHLGSVHDALLRRVWAAASLCAPR